jgi:hypothetical protein
MDFALRLQRPRSHANDMPLFPNSSSIARAEYDPYSQRLEVWFRESADQIVFRGVPVAVWRDLLEASSKSRYFDSNIRGRFSADE